MNKKYIFLTISFIILIFTLSSLQDEPIMEKLNSFPVITSLKLKLKELLPVKLSIIREFLQNFLHIPVFALLTILSLKLFEKKGIKHKRQAIYAFSIVLAISNLDELYQFFMPFRDASIIDLGLDMIGFVCGLSIYKSYIRRPCSEGPIAPVRP